MRASKYSVLNPRVPPGECHGPADQPDKRLQKFRTRSLAALISGALGNIGVLGNRPAAPGLSAVEIGAVLP